MSSIKTWIGFRPSLNVNIFLCLLQYNKLVKFQTVNIISNSIKKMLTALSECSNKLTSPQKTCPVLLRGHLKLSIWASSLRDICVPETFSENKSGTSFLAYQWVNQDCERINEQDVSQSTVWRRWLWDAGLQQNASVWLKWAAVVCDCHV